MDGGGLQWHRGRRRRSTEDRRDGGSGRSIGAQERAISLVDRGVGHRVMIGRVQRLYLPEEAAVSQGEPATAMHLDAVLTVTQCFYDHTGAVPASRLRSLLVLYLYYVPNAKWLKAAFVDVLSVQLSVPTFPELPQFPPFGTNKVRRRESIT